MARTTVIDLNLIGLCYPFMIRVVAGIFSPLTLYLSMWSLLSLKHQKMHVLSASYSVKTFDVIFEQVLIATWRYALDVLPLVHLKSVLVSWARAICFTNAYSKLKIWKRVRGKKPKNSIFQRSHHPTLINVGMLLPFSVKCMAEWKWECRILMWI